MTPRYSGQVCSKGDSLDPGVKAGLKPSDDEDEEIDLDLNVIMSFTFRDGRGAI